MQNYTRRELPHIKAKQILSWAYGTEERDKMIWKHNGLNIVSDEIYEQILSSDDNWIELLEIVHPSKINDYCDSEFQNIQMEGMCYLISNHFTSLNKFQEFDISHITFESGKSVKDDPRISTLTKDWYINHIGNWTYTITNKFIKAFVKRWIYTIWKSKEKEEQQKQNEIRIFEEQVIYRDILDKVMYIYVYLNTLSIEEFKSFGWLKVLVEHLTDNYLTLKKFDWEERWTCDVFIWVNWVTFESDPVRSNVSVWYLKWRSDIWLDIALKDFIIWIKNTPKNVFEEEIKSDLNIYDS